MPRRLRCPRCGTINTIADGAKPMCHQCGFGVPPGEPMPPPPMGQAQPGSPPLFPSAAPQAAAAAPRTRLSPLNFVGLGVLALAILVLVLLQFPLFQWSHGDMALSSDEVDVEIGIEFYAWSVTVRPEVNGEPQDPETSSYWDSEEDDTAGTWLIRIGTPVQLLGLAVAVAAGILALVRRQGLANILGWVGFALVGAGIALLAIGLQQQQEDGAEKMREMLPAGSSPTLEFSWDLAFYLAIAAAVLLGVGLSLATLRAKQQPAGGTAPRA